MNRVAILVDAGYLLAQATKVLSGGASQQRSEISITDPTGLIRFLISTAATTLGNEQLLRVYWYDGVRNGAMTNEHRAITEVDDVQFRAGTINGMGQQKGVDSKIITDLIDLASNHAICDALLVTGDGDIAVGIELAQKKGVRVALLGVGTPSIVSSQNPEILLLADRTKLIGPSDLEAFLNYTPRPPKTNLAPSASPTLPSHTQPAAAVAPASPALIDDTVLLTQVVKPFFHRQTPALLPSQVQPQIDRKIDRELVLLVAQHINKRATPAQLQTVRRQLRQLVLGQIS